MLSIMDMYGKPHKIWGYSIDRIMLSSVPGLSFLGFIFSHVPKEAFKAMEEREVDILIGLNMNHIMPEGGLGVDKVGGITVKRSKFGAGWVVGGVLDGVQEGVQQQGDVARTMSTLHPGRAAGVRAGRLAQVAVLQPPQAVKVAGIVKPDGDNVEVDHNTTWTNTVEKMKQE